MISTARITLVVVFAIFLVLHCVDCAPSSENNGARTARYIQIGAPKENSAESETETKQYNNPTYANNGNYQNGNYNGNTYNSAMPNVNNAVPNVNNAVPDVNNVMPIVNNGNIPLNEVPINGNEINNGNPMSTDLSNPIEPPPQNVGFAAVMSSFWDMVLSFVRGALGLRPREPPRIARAFIGAAVGKDECMRASACHAGRMMRGIDNNALFFTVAELLVAEDWKPVVRRVRRAAEDHEDCNAYQCNV